MEKRPKPSWIEPVNESKIPDIKLYNSLTNQKETFKPNNGTRVEWYSCGPTVYDHSHMGHARAYISIDILRRVLQNFFKFDVHYVMNITDIDDKIIKRARQNHLFSNYLLESRSAADLISDVQRTLAHLESKLAKETDEDKKVMFTKDINTVKTVLAGDIDSDSLKIIKDPLSDLLDKEKGASVTDNAIFEDLPRFYEQDFMEDMQQLNVLPPDELTRVSEYISPIISFVEAILNKGLAYESNGSVYFDTEAFDACDNHYYAKLVPSAYGNETLLREGEGALTTYEAGEKRADTDFALWKASKAGEPSWPSPWGRGRPGWHIECSAMAGDRCGPQLDIHTGGIDLKFPHHDNELAQSEARFGCAQWVNYFLHTGHLTIAGCKMSKSLKNFITIKDVLKSHSARQLRLMFLLHSWRDTLDYSPDTMAAAVSFEKTVLDFLFNVNHARKMQLLTNATIEHADELDQALEQAKDRVFQALSDSVDTRECLAALRDLMTIGNQYFIKSGTKCAPQLVEIGKYVHSILYMLGAADACDDDDCISIIRYDEAQLVTIGAGAVAVARQFIDAVQQIGNGDNGTGSRAKMDQIIDQFIDRVREGFGIDLSEQSLSFSLTDRRQLNLLIDQIASLRKSVRQISITHKWFQYLTLCDQLRDGGLVSIGVRLQDMDNDGKYAVGLMPSWAASIDRSKPAKKPASAQAVSKSKKIDPSVPPSRMFQSSGEYSLYDGDGLPTHDAAGAELSKTRLGKLRKLMAEQEKAHKKYLASQQ